MSELYKYRNILMHDHLGYDFLECFLERGRTHAVTLRMGRKEGREQYGSDGTRNKHECFRTASLKQ